MIKEYFLSILCMIPSADDGAVADAIVKVADMAFGKRRFCIHIDPAQDGAEVVNALTDPIRPSFCVLAPKLNN
jgi:hypothetical protein